MPEGASAATGARRTALNVVFTAAAQIVGKFLTLVWTLVAARQLHPDDFGLFFYALAVSTLITAVAEWGFDTILIREGSRAPARIGGLMRAALRLELGLALPALVVGGLVVGLMQDSSRLRLCVALVFGAALLEVFSDTCRAVAQAAQRQAGVAGALVVQRLASAALIVICLLTGARLTGLCLGFLGGTIVGAIAHGLALRRLQIDLSGSWRGELRPMLRASWVVGASDIALIALAKLDTVLVQGLRGSHEVGLYAATYRLLDTVLFVVFALNSGLYPPMAASGRPEDVGRGIRVGTSAAALVYAPFIAACLVDSHQIVHLIFGPSFDAAAPALQWLAVASICYALSFLAHSGMQALYLSRWLLLTATTAVGVNVVANLLLIPHYGATGAAAATTIAYGVEAVVVLVLLHRHRGVRARIAPALVVPAVAGTAYGVLLHLLPWPAPVEILAGGVVYLAAALALTRWWRPGDLDALRGLMRREVTAG